MGVIRWLNGLIWLGVLVPAIIAAYILYQRDLALDHGRAEPAARFGIVLGSGADPDGMLAWSSRQAVQRAVGMLADGRVETLIFSGGSRLEGDPKPAAERMRELAIARGADPDRLLVEDRARTTVENIIYSMRQAGRLGARPDGSDAILITDSYHIARCLLLARYLGHDSLTAVASDRMRPFGLTRTTERTVYEVGAMLINAARIARWELAGWPPGLAEAAE